MAKYTEARAAIEATIMDLSTGLRNDEESLRYAQGQVRECQERILQRNDAIVHLRSVEITLKVMDSKGVSINVP